MKTVNLLIALLIMLNTACAQKMEKDEFTAPNGKKIEMYAIKHACVRIVYDGKEIEIDPVGKMEPATDYSKLPKADIILVTHEHFDHCDADAVAKLSTDKTLLIANPNSAKMLKGSQVMKNGDSKKIADDITLDAVAAYNITPGHTQFHPKGRDNGYILTLGGFKVYIAGDTEDIEEMKSLKNIDVAFLPVNQPYTMTPEQAARAVKWFAPKVLFPYHYSQTKISEVSDLLKGSGIDVRIRNYQ